MSPKSNICSSDHEHMFPPPMNICGKPHEHMFMKTPFHNIRLHVIYHNTGICW